jgi:Isopropylmalate/homocitrate/citramalate synthases
MTNAIGLKLIECPRDAMQGWKSFIPTKKKVEYVNSLLKVGFDTIDFGSFVSAKAIPQMADTKEVVQKLELDVTKSKLLAIAANARGASDASQYDQITYIGYPFSISETFQKRNSNSTIEESVIRVEEIQNICLKNNKILVIYLSMGFGNPYGDPYNQDILLKWAGEMVERGIRIISLADTVGLATPDQIKYALNTLIPEYKNVEIGVHLHSRADNWKPKFEAALNSGCKRFDGALKGIGGCPMAQDDLVGNMRTELIIDLMNKKQVPNGINSKALQESLLLASQIFTDEVSF